MEGKLFRKWMKPRKGPRISPQASRSSYWNWWRNIKVSSDICTNAKKDVAWKRIEHDFNSQCPSGCHRNAKILKKKYNNLKREVKKRVAEEKKSLYLTGGGPPPKKLLTQFDEKLLTVLHEKQVSGMQSVYDNDVIAGNNDESVILEEETLESIMDFEKSTEVENYEGINESDNVESSQLWNKYDPSKLKTPKNSKLKFEEKPQRSAKNSWAKLADMKAKWTEEKYEAEIKIMYAEHEQRMKLMKEKHDMEMKILAVDLERKKKKLEG